MIVFVPVIMALAGAPDRPWCQPPAENPPAAREKLQDASGIVIEKFDTVVRFEWDGTGERTLTVVARVESSAAVRELGVLAFSFNSSGEELSVDYVRVRTGMARLWRRRLRTFRRRSRRQLRPRRCTATSGRCRFRYVHSQRATPSNIAFLDTDQARYSRSVLVYARLHQRRRSEIRDADGRCASGQIRKGGWRPP